MENTDDYFYRVSIMDVLGKLWLHRHIQKVDLFVLVLWTHMHSPQSDTRTMGINGVIRYIVHGIFSEMEASRIHNSI